MKKKFYLLSLVLMGSISLFTSCVDGDYYDLYDDEEEFLSPRNKKGKEAPNVAIDGALYELMQEEGEYRGWHYAECAACCYSYFTNADRIESRYAMIVAQYGCFNGNSCGFYIAAAKTNYCGISPSALCQALGSGWHTSSVVTTTNAMYNGTIDWAHLAVIVNNNSHVGAVTGHTVKQESDGVKYDLTYDDQYGTGHHCYVWKKNNGQVYQDPSITQFITR